MFEFTWGSYKNHPSRFKVNKLSPVKQGTGGKML